jgi:S-DNA-T family DNA segregation ATPase FtsK/SpoIIIE
LKNKNKKSKPSLPIANLPKPISIVQAQPVVYPEPEPMPDMMDTTTNDVEGMGIRRRGRKPKMGGAIAVANHAKLLGSKTMVKQGGALYPAGGALYPAGGALYPAGGALYPAGYIAPRF